LREIEAPGVAREIGHDDGHENPEHGRGDAVERLHQAK
jgi:hypothetical protein